MQVEGWVEYRPWYLNVFPCLKTEEQHLYDRSILSARAARGIETPIPALMGRAKPINWGKCAKKCVIFICITILMLVVCVAMVTLLL